LGISAPQQRIAISRHKPVHLIRPRR
jgi:hypothetical protein